MRNMSAGDWILQGVKAVIKGQQGMLAEGHDRRFFDFGQNRRCRLFGDMGA